MKYSVSKNNVTTLPAYMQLYTQLREDIVGGIYHLGQRLPSKRMLSEELGVSVITIEHAYAILADEGYVESRERSGYFVSYDPGETLNVPKRINDERELALLQPVMNEFYKNDLILRPEKNPEMFPYSTFAKTMRKVITNYQERLFVKAPYNGCIELRQAICDYLARSRGINVNASQIIIGSGSEYLYTIVAQFLRTDRYENIFALEDPSYEKIRRVYEANGIKCEMLKMGEDGIESIYLKRTRARVLHITPYNSFPSGITTSASKRKDYINWAFKNKKIIIEDDYDSEFTMTSKVADTVFALANSVGINRVIYMNTFSKTIAPSMRVGYMIIPKELIEHFEKYLSFYSCTVPVFEQYLLAELINNGDFERHINRVRRRRRQNKS